MSLFKDISIALSVLSEAGLSEAGKESSMSPSLMSASVSVVCSDLLPTVPLRSNGEAGEEGAFLLVCEASVFVEPA